MKAPTPVHVGVVEVICPVCEEVIPVEVTARIIDTADAHQMTLHCEPDLTDLWAHSFTHDQDES